MADDDKKPTTPPAAEAPKTEAPKPAASPQAEPEQERWGWLGAGLFALLAVGIGAFTGVGAGLGILGMIGMALAGGVAGYFLGETDGVSEWVNKQLGPSLNPNRDGGPGGDTQDPTRPPVNPANINVDTQNVGKTKEGEGYSTGELAAGAGLATLGTSMITAIASKLGLGLVNELGTARRQLNGRNASGATTATGQYFRDILNSGSVRNGVSIAVGRPLGGAVQYLFPFEKPNTLSFWTHQKNVSLLTSPTWAASQTARVVGYNGAVRIWNNLGGNLHYLSGNFEYFTDFNAINSKGSGFSVGPDAVTDSQDRKVLERVYDKNGVKTEQWRPADPVAYEAAKPDANFQKFLRVNRHIFNGEIAPSWQIMDGKSGFSVGTDYVLHDGKPFMRQVPGKSTWAIVDADVYAKAAATSEFQAAEKLNGWSIETTETAKIKTSTPPPASSAEIAVTGGAPSTPKPAPAPAAPAPTNVPLADPLGELKGILDKDIRLTSDQNQQQVREHMQKTLEHMQKNHPAEYKNLTADAIAEVTENYRKGFDVHSKNEPYLTNELLVRAKTATAAAAAAAPAPATPAPASTPAPGTGTANPAATPTASTQPAPAQPTAANPPTPVKPPTPSLPIPKNAKDAASRAFYDPQNSPESAKLQKEFQRTLERMLKSKDATVRQTAQHIIDNPDIAERCANQLKNDPALATDMKRVFALNASDPLTVPQQPAQPSKPAPAPAQPTAATNPATPKTQSAPTTPQPTTQPTVVEPGAPAAATGPSAKSVASVAFTAAAREAQPTGTGLMSRIYEGAQRQLNKMLLQGQLSDTLGTMQKSGTTAQQAAADYVLNNPAAAKEVAANLLRQGGKPDIGGLIESTYNASRTGNAAPNAAPASTPNATAAEPAKPAPTASAGKPTPAAPQPDATQPAPQKPTTSTGTATAEPPAPVKTPGAGDTVPGMQALTDTQEMPKVKTPKSITGAPTSSGFTPEQQQLAKQFEMFQNAARHNNGEILRNIGMSAQDVAGLQAEIKPGNVNDLLAYERSIAKVAKTYNVEHVGQVVSDHAQKTGAPAVEPLPENKGKSGGTSVKGLAAGALPGGIRSLDKFLQGKPGEGVQELGTTGGVLGAFYYAEKGAQALKPGMKFPAVPLAGAAISGVTTGMEAFKPFDERDNATILKGGISAAFYTAAAIPGPQQVVALPAAIANDVLHATYDLGMNAIYGEENRKIPMLMRSISENAQTDRKFVIDHAPKLDLKTDGNNQIASLLLLSATPHVSQYPEVDKAFGNLGEHEIKWPANDDPKKRKDQRVANLVATMPINDIAQQLQEQKNLAAATAAKVREELSNYYSPETADALINHRTRAQVIANKTLISVPRDLYRSVAGRPEDHAEEYITNALQKYDAAIQKKITYDAALVSLGANAQMEQYFDMKTDDGKPFKPSMPAGMSFAERKKAATETLDSVKAFDPALYDLKIALNKAANTYYASEGQPDRTQKFDETVQAARNVYLNDEIMKLNAAVVKGEKAEDYVTQKYNAALKAGIAPHEAETFMLTPKNYLQTLCSYCEARRKQGEDINIAGAFGIQHATELASRSGGKGLYWVSDTKSEYYNVPPSQYGYVVNGAYEQSSDINDKYTSNRRPPATVDKSVAWVDVEYQHPTGVPVTKRLTYQTVGDTTQVIGFHDAKDPNAKAEVPAWLKEHIAKNGALPAIETHVTNFKPEYAVGVRPGAMIGNILKAEIDAHTANPQRFDEKAKYEARLVAANLEQIQIRDKKISERMNVLAAYKPIVEAANDKQKAGQESFRAGTVIVKKNELIFAVNEPDHNKAWGRAAELREALGPGVEDTSIQTATIGDKVSYIVKVKLQDTESLLRPARRKAGDTFFETGKTRLDTYFPPKLASAIKQANGIEDSSSAPPTRLASANVTEATGSGLNNAANKPTTPGAPEQPAPLKP